MYHVLIPLVIRQSAVLRRSYASNPSTFRRFSVTPRPQAAESEDSFISQFKNTTIFQKIADKPEALIAIQNFASLLQKEGIEPGSGMPSTMKMFRLAAKEEFRAAATKVMTELKKAGVDLNSADAMQEIMRVNKGDSGRRDS